MFEWGEWENQTPLRLVCHWDLLTNHLLMGATFKVFNGCYLQDEQRMKMEITMTTTTSY